MPGLIGKKIGMTSLFNSEGKNIACTILQVGPCKVTQIKTLETDGYEAVQPAIVGISSYRNTLATHAFITHNSSLFIVRSKTVFYQ